jgi:hypothetical protein
MKIRTTVNLTEAQKARIVSRNEPLPQRICTFDISPEKAEIISRLKGTYNVTMEVSREVMISATDEKYSSDPLQVVETYGYNPDWKVAQEKIKLMDILAEAYAAGTISEGGNIDFALDIMALALQRRDDFLQQNEEVQAEKARKEEAERHAKAAQAIKEAQEKAERDRIEAEEKARKDAEDKAWIDEHGSERLRKGYASGYRCLKLYETERAQSILGDDYVLDSKEVEEKDRSCPSLEALQEVERLKQVIEKGAAIVWLPQGISGEDETGCEAVKVDPGTFSRHYFYRVASRSKDTSV